MDASMQDVGNTSRTLEYLPSEIRKLIVSFLVPTRLKPGSKEDLKNANLAHRCLHEWATEYMFRDMALQHVLPGISSQVERFAVQRDNSKLLKFVKHIEIQVPPAIRWDHGTDPIPPFIEEITQQRFLTLSGTQSYEELDSQSQDLCNAYHRAMVAPFTVNRHWIALFQSATSVWPLVLLKFKNLETITVQCCRRWEHPPPTASNTFFLEHGRGIELNMRPRWTEDDTVNRAWASSLILSIVPPSVRFLELTWAHTDNLSRMANVNRLLARAYELPARAGRITRLCLVLMGEPGTHGSRDWQGGTGSAAGIRYWQKAINSMSNLEYLIVRDMHSYAEDLNFTDGSTSNANECILDWFLPGLHAPRLRTLVLNGFRYDHAKTALSLRAIWRNLTTLVFRHSELALWSTADIDAIMEDDEIEDKFTTEQKEHLQGAGWLTLCQSLQTANPHGRIKILNEPVLSINYVVHCPMHPDCAERLRRCGVIVDDDHDNYTPDEGF